MLCNVNLPLLSSVQIGASRQYFLIRRRVIGKDFKLHTVGYMALRGSASLLKKHRRTHQALWEIKAVVLKEREPKLPKKVHDLILM